MVKIPDVNMIQLTFMGDNYAKAIEGYDDLIGASVERQLERPEWKAEVLRRFEECAKQVSQLHVELSELSKATGEALGGPEILPAWRRNMENVCEHIRDPRLKKRALKAIGWGLGSPASIKEAKEFLVAVDGGARGFQKDLLAAGAEPEDIAFPAQALAKLKGVSAAVMKEEADVDISRKSTRKACEEAREAVAMVTLAAEFAKSKAVQRRDKAAEARADSLIALLQAGINQSDVLTRTKVENEDVPEELVTPLPTPSDDGNNGGNNDGN